MLVVVCTYAQISYSQIIKSVKDAQSLQPLNDVTVYDAFGRFVTYSNELGVVVLPDSLSSVIITLEKPGFKSLYLDLSHDHGDDIFLSRHSQVLEEVAIVWQSAYLGLPTFANIDSRSIEQLNGIPQTNLMQSLAEIPGVYSSNTGPGISKPVIRGLQGNRILTFFDGYKLEGQQWGGDHGLGITELGVKDVSVVKGPAALLYGADAMGGVLLINDGFWETEQGLKISAFSQFETNSMGTTSAAQIQHRKNKWAWQAGGRFTSHADYKIAKKQFVDNSRFNEYNAKLGLGFYGGKFRSTLQVLMTQNQIGLPGHTHDSDPDESSFVTNVQKRNKILPVQYNKQWFTIWNAEWQFSNKDVLKLTTGFTHQNLLEHDHKHTIPALGMITQNIPVQLMFHHTQKRSMLTAGLQGMYNQITNNKEAEEILIPNANQKDVGAVLKMQWDRVKWKTEFGIRGDFRHINAKSFSKTYFGANAGWNTTIHFGSKRTLKVGLNSGFRIPHLSELLANGAHHGTFRYEIGNRNLKPEKAVQIDVSYDRMGDHFSFILNPFVALLNDFIYLNPTGQSINSMPIFEYKQINWALQYGADVGIHWHPHFAHSWHLESTISYLNYASNSTAFSLIPAPRWNSSLKYEPTMKGKIRIEDVQLQFTYFFPQKNTVSYEWATADYGLLNVGMNTVFGSKERWKIQIAVRNLTNKQYIDHLSRLKPLGLYNPGRNIIIKLIYNL